MSVKQSHTSVMRMGILVVSIFAFAAVFATPISAHAEYDCGTYSAGDYNDASCDETMTESGNTGTGTTNSDSSADTSATDEPENVTQQETISLNDYDEYNSGLQKLLDLNEGQIVNFTIGSEVYSITIKSITDEKLVVTINSISHDLTIEEGHAVSEDVNGDGVSDIMIRYNGRNGTVGTVGFTSLEVKSAMPIIDEQSVAKTNSAWVPWMIASIIALVALIAVIIFRKSKKA